MSAEWLVALAFGLLVNVVDDVAINRLRGSEHIRARRCGYNDSFGESYACSANVTIEDSRRWAWLGAEGPLKMA